MSAYLDLDDVVAGHPVATKELEELRTENATLRELVREALDPEFKWSRTLWRERAEKALERK